MDDNKVIQVLHRLKDQRTLTDLKELLMKDKDLPRFKTGYGFVCTDTHFL